MFGFSLMRLGVYALIAVVGVGSIYTGYRVWRHSVWVEGRDAALAAVEKVNTQAATAARQVELSTDACFDQGGTWDVSTGRCDLGSTTLHGVSSLFGD